MLRQLVPAAAAALTGAVALPATTAQADTITLTGTIRDFRVDHPDFETYPGTYNKVAMDLDAQGKPVLDMGYYNAKLGTSEQSVHSPESFAQWFRDDPDVNIAIPFAIELDNHQAEPGGVYSWAREKQLSGDLKYFFPIDDQGFGLTYPMDGHPLRWESGGVHNFHFTYELKTKFSYTPGQVFRFVGDDDVFVFINGKLVVDLGGVHSQEDAHVLLFDGKAFVSDAYRDREGVMSVDAQMADQLATQWASLGLGGDCPVGAGDRYVDLGLNLGTDIRCEFDGNTVNVYSETQLANVVVKFGDGSVVRHENLQGTQAAFTGESEIVGCWVKSGDNASGDGAGYGEWFSPSGGSLGHELDLFFAERHTSESNFRIETNLILDEVPPSTISPTYD